MRVTGFIAAQRIAVNEHGGLDVTNAPVTGMRAEQFPHSAGLPVALFLEGETGVDTEAPVFRIGVSYAGKPYDDVSTVLLEWPDPQGSPIKHLHQGLMIEFPAAAPGLYEIGLFEEQGDVPIAGTTVWITPK